MLKFKVLGAVWVLANVVIVVSPALAYALNEWLVDSGVVANPVASDSEETLTFKGLTTGTETQCDSQSEGFVGAGVKDEVTHITELAKPTVTLIPCRVLKGGSIGCEEPSSADALNLSWVTELELVEIETGVTALRDLIGPHAGGGNPGWVIDCTIGGVFKVASECTAPDLTTAVELNAQSKDVDMRFDAHTENLTCKNGELATVRGSILVLVTNKELTVNSD